MTDLAGALADALSHGELSAWFQPQLDLLSAEIVGAEALCRWNHPVFGAVEPSVFIPLAERIGVIEEIGRFMADEGCRAALAWSRHRPPIEVSVNVSPLQLTSSAFTDHLSRQLSRFGLGSHALTIEITESLPVADLPSVVRRLDGLQKLGIGVAIDDFGVGHSSLRQVRRMHATELKIDRSLVIDESPGATTMLIGVVEQMHETGIRVVAEGVETQQQLARVRALGCDRAQGYLIGRPMPRAQFEQLVA